MKNIYLNVIAVSLIKNIINEIHKFPEKITTVHRDYFYISNMTPHNASTYSKQKVKLVVLD